MSAYSRRVRRSTRVEFVIPGPGYDVGVPYVEVLKAIEAAKAELPSQSIFDNTIKVIANDDDIIVYFEEASQ